MTAMAQALSTALLDFVWQGLLAAFLLWVALCLLKNRSARARYLASCVALAAMAMLPVITICLVYSAPGAPQASAAWAGGGAQAMRAAAQGTPGSSLNWVMRLEPWALPVWSLGVLLFSLRLVWASRQVSRLRRQALPPGDALRVLIAGLTERLHVTRPVRVLVSAAADCPSVIGWIKPAVLLPAATVAGLTPQQLEAVLAHEFAHIMRYDHLVNMLQTVVETLLFYHPAVWWTSARIRHERELCCDDLAVDSCGDALGYARALTRLERLRVMNPRLALGSTGGPLLYRIQRLVGEAGRQGEPSKLPGILALSLGLVCLALNMQWARGQQQDPVAHEAAALESSALDEPGVQVDLGGATVIHREGVEYPPSAMEKSVQGTVVVEASLDAAGVVSDARVLSGPAELRKAVLESVLQWHFSRDAAGSARQVSITFQTPAESVIRERSAVRAKHQAEAHALEQAARERAVVESMVQEQAAANMERQMRAYQDEQAAQAADAEVQAKRLAELDRQLASDKLAAAVAEQARAIPERLEQARELENQLMALRSESAELEGSASGFAAARTAQMAAMEKRMAELKQSLDDVHSAPIFAGRRLKSINIQGLTRPLRDELLAKLPVHVGDTLAEDSMERIEAAVKQFDEHLGLSMFTTRDGQAEIRITAPGSGDTWEPRH